MRRYNRTLKYTELYKLYSIFSLKFCMSLKQMYQTERTVLRVFGFTPNGTPVPLA